MDYGEVEEDAMNIQEEAVKIVMDYEQKQGRKPKDVTRDRKAVGYDVLSDGRKIEVKGLGGRNPFFGLNNYNFECFRKEPDFYLYLVFDILKSPKLIIYDRVEMAEKIKNANIYFNFEIPLRKKDWEEGKPI